MTYYHILNSAVITTPGTYKYTLIPFAHALEWLSKNNWVSTIGYEETASALQEITGIQIPVNRTIIRMNVGDEALVFRVVFPQGYRPDPTQKGQLGKDFISKHCEIGLLKKIE